MAPGISAVLRGPALTVGGLWMKNGSRGRHPMRATHVIASATGVDHNGMRAFVVAAIDEESVGAAGRPHFLESDFHFF